MSPADGPAYLLTLCAAWMVLAALAHRHDHNRS